MSLAIGATGCGNRRRDQQDSSNQRSTHSWPRGAHLLPTGAHAHSCPRGAYHARRDRFSDFRPRDLAIAPRRAASGTNVSGNRAIIATMTVRLSRASLTPRSIMAARVAASLAFLVASSRNRASAIRNFTKKRHLHTYTRAHTHTHTRAREIGDRCVRRFFSAEPIVPQ